MAQNNIPVGQAQYVTASGNQKVGQGLVIGVLVNTSTSGNLSLYNDAATGTAVPICVSVPLVAGAWIDIPVGFSNGLNVVLGGTATITLVYL